MRILRVSGHNLASLERFDLDFEAEPLRTAGTFAITGPTGAGKSTLLDAVCVALFDRTPRLCDEGGVDITDLQEKGGDRVTVKANDVRTLLRRGAGQGWAEVEFIGADHQAYRSRWAVQRARGSASGKLQNQTMTLHRLDAQRSPVEVIGRTKTETLAEIAKLIGLSFEQFRRAVLLAQGDFAAFLRAKPHERAELLERMTDTGLYAEISRQAHLEAAWWRDAVALANAQCSAVRVLETLDLQVLMEEQAALAAERAAAAELAAAARAASAWHSQRGTLAVAIGEAEARLNAALAAQQAQAQLAGELAQAAAAAAHRPAWAEAQRLRREVDQAVRRLEERLAQRDAALAALADADAARQAAEARLAAAEAAAQEAAPELRAARELDTKLAEARRELDLRAAELREAARQAAEAAAAAAALGASLSAAEARRDQQDRWLADHAEVQALAAAADGWAPALAEAQQLCSADADLAAAVRAADAEVRQAEAQLHAAQTAAETAATAAAQADAAAAEGEKALADAADGDLPARIAAAGSEFDRCRRQADRAAAQAKAVAERAADLASREKHSAGAKSAGDRAQEARGREPELAGQVREAEATLQRLQAALELSDRRGQLVAGEPCPLCGATEHPWAEAAPNPLVDSQRQRLDVLRAEQRALGQSAAEAEAAARAAAQAMADLDARLLRAEADLAERQEAWQRDRGDGWPAQAADPAAQGSAQALLAAAKHQRDQLQMRLEARERLATAARQLRAQATASAAAATAAQAAAQQRDLALVDRRSAAGLAGQRAEQHAQRWREVEQALAGLAALRPAWLSLLHSQPAQVAKSVSEAKALWQQGLAQRDSAAQELLDLRPQQAAAQARAEGLRQAQAQGQQRLDLAHAGVEQLHRDRQALLGARPADEVEALLRRAQTEAREALDRGREKASAAAAQAAAANADHLEAEISADRLKTQGQSAELALAASLTALGIAEAELSRRLERDDAWQRATRERLDLLAHHVASAQGAQQQAESALADHLRTPPDLDASAATAALAMADQRCRTLDGRAGEIRAQLHENDLRLAQQTALAAQLAQTKRLAEPWLNLGKAIGSKDGKAFRVFAQGLTLDVLVRHANVHLGGLSRRYRLQRVPGADLELQVTDADMADEIRGLATLSGGETFLVSLALALALASLSSKTAAIESLFIDEGFGTLDKDTLSTAVAVLNRLQQSGRKVGVISHVDGLAEALDAEIQVLARGQGRSEVRVRGR
jgi:exonuclease SbcC